MSEYVVIEAAPIAPSLAAAYCECRRITHRHSSSYSWATALLPADRRPHVYALYAFARVADDIVDRPGVDPCHALAEFRRRFEETLAGAAAPTPVLAAVTHTVNRLAIPEDTFRRFFRSMEMDLSVAEYATWPDLLDYMDGSAAAIGEMMLPVLEPVDASVARSPARSLGLAFQLTNFLRDIGEDLDRDRRYLPSADLAMFGVHLAERRVTPPFRELMRFEIARCRALYREADVGLALLPTRSARCVRAASALYEAILDEIVANDLDVFRHRASVSSIRKLVVVASSMRRPSVHGHETSRDR